MSCCGTDGPQHTYKTHDCIDTSPTQKHRATLSSGFACACIFWSLCSFFAREQPQEVGRSSANKQHTFRKTLHSPEHHTRADVENNGHFLAQASHACVPQQTRFHQPVAWLSRDCFHSQKQPPHCIESHFHTSGFKHAALEPTVAAVGALTVEYRQSTVLEWEEQRAVRHGRRYLVHTGRRWSRRDTHIGLEPHTCLRFDSRFHTPLWNEGQQMIVSYDMTLSSNICGYGHNLKWKYFLVSLSV